MGVLHDFTVQYRGVGFRGAHPPQEHGGQEKAGAQRHQVHRVDDACVQGERPEGTRKRGEVPLPRHEAPSS